MRNTEPRPTVQTCKCRDPSAGDIPGTANRCHSRDRRAGRTAPAEKIKKTCSGGSCALARLDDVERGNARDKGSHDPVESDAPAERPVRQRAEGAIGRRGGKNLQARAGRPKRHMGKLEPRRRSQGGSETFGDVPRGSLQTLLRVLHSLGRLLANACPAFFSLSVSLSLRPTLSLLHVSSGEGESRGVASALQRQRVALLRHTSGSWKSEASDVSSCDLFLLLRHMLRFVIISQSHRYRLEEDQKRVRIGTLASCCEGTFAVAKHSTGRQHPMSPQTPPGTLSSRRRGLTSCGLAHLIGAWAFAASAATGTPLAQCMNMGVLLSPTTKKGGFCFVGCVF